MLMVAVTEAAKRELAKYRPDDGGPVTLRFYMETEGGWSATFDYDLALDEPRPDDEVFDNGEVQVIVDRGTYFYIDEPMKIDFDEQERAFRIRATTHVIPTRIKL